MLSNILAYDSKTSPSDINSQTMIWGFHPTKWGNPSPSSLFLDHLEMLTCSTHLSWGPSSSLSAVIFLNLTYFRAFQIIIILLLSFPSSSDFIKIYSKCEVRVYL